ncbi:RNA polymerase sigma factor [Methylomonas methanica]|uniref:RNA polymerase, sigma-24 subunit, ECF subfamily n=1 Tax=Methylomonas methanica (strain DSM 25384 / MC09) TaxID=857087 RepID=F9ZZ89_METMM|nr:RNA polymerase sigma factor [Methylomonas methanica]AEG01115.1 RNA polymerase, sigma-24 subunit, ECF subfamily [Methylomonas methanica MC09]
MNTNTKTTLVAAFILHQMELRQFLLRKVNCRETAADLLQDTYVRIAQLEAGDEIVNPRAFLYRVAGNLALDYLRSQCRRAVWDGGEITDDCVCPQPQPDVVLASRERMQIFNYLLRQLPPQQHEVFVGCRVEGKSYRQIADEARISARRAERIAQQTLKSLKIRMA